MKMGILPELDIVLIVDDIDQIGLSLGIQQYYIHTREPINNGEHILPIIIINEYHSKVRDVR
jgi:hypothetical protein